MRLLKCQYDLKQAGREWHTLLINWPVEEMIKDEVLLMVRVHVDGIIVSGGKNTCDKIFAHVNEGTVSHTKPRGTKHVHRLCFRSQLGIRHVRDEPDYIYRKPGGVV